MSHLSVKDWALNKCFTWSGKLEEKFEIFGIFVLLVTKPFVALHIQRRIRSTLFHLIIKRKDTEDVNMLLLLQKTLI